MVSRKIKLRLFIGGVCVLAVVALTIRTRMCLECGPVISFLKETREIVFTGVDDQATSLLDSQIRRIRLTQMCDLPLVFSASVLRNMGDQSRFWVSVDWVQRKGNQREFIKLNLHFDLEDGKEELTFDISRSSSIDDSDNEDVFGDNFSVLFDEDAGSIKDADSSTFVLPYEFSNSPAYISLTDNNGMATDWIKCNVVELGGLE